ncbi:MAG: hypothetical protein QW320_06570 [Ignisphaera sp.]|uniref:hypothetical protein n=1 Tax=Thermofilum sp. TaxID=1961369 RepID=UPI00316216FE
MGVVVSRRDGYILHTDVGLAKARTLLDSYLNMSRFKRARWLMQYGNVFSYYGSAALPVGVYASPEEFIKDFIEKNKVNVRNGGVSQASVDEWCERFKEFFSHPITHTRLERRKKEVKVVKASVLYEFSHAVMMYLGVEYFPRPEMATSKCLSKHACYGVSKFSETSWIWAQDLGNTYLVSVRNDVGLDDVVASMSEIGKNMDVVEEITSRVSPDSLLELCSELEDARDWCERMVELYKAIYAFAELTRLTRG